jgi:hypothetical protein
MNQEDPAKMGDDLISRDVHRSVVSIPQVCGISKKEIFEKGAKTKIFVEHHDPTIG